MFDVIEEFRKTDAQIEKGVMYVGNYVKENWKPLAIGAGVVAVAGITLYVTKGTKVVILPNTVAGDVITKNMNSFFGPFFSRQNFTITHYNGSPGNPGIMNYWVEGQQVSPSFSRSAEISGQTPRYVADVVKGVQTPTEGYTFVRVTP